MFWQLKIIIVKIREKIRENPGESGKYLEKNSGK